MWTLSDGRRVHVFNPKRRGRTKIYFATVGETDFVVEINITKARRKIRPKPIQARSIFYDDTTTTPTKTFPRLDS